ncbi:MAG: hypothetical protein K0R24_789 [Gammaproteobacteria bacterium]|jgi:hypothetical protein|nr:hypothetical protein [Gammaproteobacteria bacterium]
MQSTRNNRDYSYELKMVNNEVNEPTLTVHNFETIQATLTKEAELANNYDEHAIKKLNALLKKVLFRWFVFKQKYRENLDGIQLNDIEETLNYKGTIATKLVNFYSALSTAFVKESTRMQRLENLFNDCVPATNTQEHNRLRQAYEKEIQAKQPKKPASNMSDNCDPSALQQIHHSLNELVSLQGNGSSFPISNIDDAIDQQLPILENKKFQKLQNDLKSAQELLQKDHSIYQVFQDEKDNDAIEKNHGIRLLKAIEKLKSELSRKDYSQATREQKLFAQKICYLNIYKGLNAEIKRLTKDYLLEEDESIKQIITTRKKAIQTAMDQFNSFLHASNQSNNYDEAKNILTNVQNQMVSTGKNHFTNKGSDGNIFFGFYNTVTGRDKIKALIKSIEKEENKDAPPKKSLFSFSSMSS